MAFSALDSGRVLVAVARGILAVGRPAVAEGVGSHGVVGGGLVGFDSEVIV